MHGTCLSALIATTSNYKHFPWLMAPFLFLEDNSYYTEARIGGGFWFLPGRLSFGWIQVYVVTLSPFSSLSSLAVGAWFSLS